MADFVAGVAYWPGVVGVIGCRYECSHGITPGIAQLRMQPQATFPAAYGDLVIGDGQSSITLRDARIESMSYTYGENGYEWTLEISDRRWRWKSFGFLEGVYNQLDPHGKLIPWTVRSPYELAVICLLAMGEFSYFVDMPPGVTKAMGAAESDILRNGVNFPAIGVNPCTEWDGGIPANYLQNLLDSVGRRLVYDPITNKTFICRPGVGAALPTAGFSVASENVGLKNPKLPDGLMIQGDPTKFQVRLDTEPVGEEWDGMPVPINELSYAPLRPAGTTQKTTCHWRRMIDNGVDGLTVYLKVSITGTLFTGNEVQRVIVFKVMSLATSLLTAVTNLKNDLANHPLFFPWLQCTATSLAGGVEHVGLDLVSSDNLRGFTVEEVKFTPTSPMSEVPEGCEGWHTQERVAAVSNQKTWEYSPPPYFPGVRATERLTVEQARQKAQKSVWKWYRISGMDITGDGPINVPGYGRIVRRQQIVLTNTKVDQIVPEPILQNAVDRQGRAIVLYHYDGYSKDKPAEAFGSIAQYLNGITYLGSAGLRMNTPINSLILVPFTVDQRFQMFVFSDFVYRFGSNNRIRSPELIVETGVYIRNAVTNQLETFKRVEPFASGDLRFYHVAKRPDVQANITATYNENGTIANVSYLESDPLSRSYYYIQAMKLQYQWVQAGTLKYNGIIPISLDGAITQVTWSFDENGIETTASRNSEHSSTFLPYPARRRIERLDPVLSGDRGFLPTNIQRTNVMNPDNRS